MWPGSLSVSCLTIEILLVVLVRDCLGVSDDQFGGHLALIHNAVWSHRMLHLEMKCILAVAVYQSQVSHIVGFHTTQR